MGDGYRVHIPGRVAAVRPLGLPSAHNGEVWRGQCRESARTALRRIGTAAARQPLKLKRYKSDVGGLRPLRGRTFTA